MHKNNFAINNCFKSPPRSKLTFLQKLNIFGKVDQGLVVCSSLSMYISMDGLLRIIQVLSDFMSTIDSQFIDVKCIITSVTPLMSYF